MKRVVRSKSGREIYGPKWQNNNNSSENENSDSRHPSNTVQITEIAPVSNAAVPPAVSETNVVDYNDSTALAYLEGSARNDAAESSTVLNPTNVDVIDQDQTSAGIYRREIRLSNSHETMYRATLRGDCVAVEMLLEEHPHLGIDEITQEGDRALHLAASMERQEIVEKLVKKMSSSDLALLDGRGYTACCYAAIAGSVEIADLIMRNNPTLATARDRENKTPLQKAALRGNTKLVSYFLKSTKLDALSNDEWFDLLLVTIRRKMYDVALEISGSNEQLATMRNDDGTALHLLARQHIFQNVLQRINGVMRQDMRLLAKQLLAGIERLGQTSVIELMTSPPILHDAAEEGNVELITMLTQSYPELVWHTNNKGYTIFHIAVNYRHYHLFGLINEIGARKDLIAISQDEDGNNILHLAAELAPPERSWTLVITAFQMQREILWFEKVRAIVPPLCLEMRNKEGQTPTELFLKRHKSLLEESRTWIRNTSDSCMLISTLIFTVVFASAFAVPGGYNQNTGVPVLSKTDWFTCFVIFEALAMFSSALCIVCFLRIMMMGYSEIHFVSQLPNWFVWGINGLSFSVFGAISAFMSAYFMIYAKERTALVESVIVFLYVVIASVVCFQIYIFWIYLPKRLLRKQTRHTLFKRPDAVTATKNKRWCWIF